MRIRSAIAIFVTAAAAALAQAPAAAPQTSMKGVVRKNLAPVSTEVLRVKLPRPVERTLKNGVKVLVIENHRVPLVSMQLVVPASSLNDPAGLPGVAQATAELMKSGTKTRTSREIVEQVSELGGALNVFSDFSSRTSLSASALTENFDQVLAVAADVLLNPTFPQDELDKWKKRALAGIQQRRSNPGLLGQERFFEALYAGDPRANFAPKPEPIAKLSREDLVAFHKANFVPSGSILGVTGDAKPDEIVAKLDKALAGWTGGPPKSPDVTAPKPPIGDKRVYLVNRPASVQTYLILGNHAIDRLSPDFIPVQVLNRVLGSGPSSRLFIIIREEKGFTYGVYSSFRATKYLDQFMASSSVRTDVTGPALDEFLKEFRRIREEAVPSEELENAKRAIVAGFALSIENQNGVLGQILHLYENGLPADYWDTYPEKVMAVTAADVQRVARKYVPLENLQVVAVGDGAKIRELLKKYGPVEEYSTDGKRVD